MTEIVEFELNLWEDRDSYSAEDRKMFDDMVKKHEDGSISINFVAGVSLPAEVLKDAVVSKSDLRKVILERIAVDLDEVLSYHGM